MQNLIESILYQYSYPAIYGLTFFYFMVLYFGMAPIYQFLCEILEKKGVLNKIAPRQADKNQIRYEKKHSFLSIVLFGFSSIPIIYLIRTGYIELLPDSLINIIGGIVILSLWNEVHFYLVHRIMHIPFMMKNVHYIHHKSSTPTVYSVYSFHWLEAFLLSTVPLTIMPIIPFSIIAVFFYPLASILLNFAGHCNYRFGTGRGKGWWLLGTRHNQHHTKGRKSYGFALDFLDRLFSKRKH